MPRRLHGLKLRTTSRSWPLTYLTAALFTLAPVLVGADLPVARLAAVTPPGARAGTVVEVTLAGADLDDVSEIRFSNPGLFAKSATDGTGKIVPNKFLVAVPPSVPLGRYDVRVAGRFGVSNPRTFVVGYLPELVEKAGNASPGSAMPVSAGCVINGQCESSAVDHYSVPLKRGQRVFVDCASGDIDSKLDPVLVLVDGAGREVATARRQGVIDVSAPADGPYVLKVHDAMYRGGPEYFYRLSVSTRPQIDFVLPPAGQPGTKSKFMLFGRNLPGGAPAAGMTVDGKPLEQVVVEIDLPARDTPAAARRAARSPIQAAIDGFEWSLITADRGASIPVFIAFSDTPPVAEQFPADAGAPPQKVTPPVEVTGHFFPRLDRDAVEFEAKKGEVWWVELFCQRLGAPADGFLLVQRVAKDEKGQEKAVDLQEVYEGEANFGGAEFNTAGRDAVYRLEVKEDGLYRVQARDLFNTTRDDPRLAYRLVVRKEAPDFRLVALPVRAEAGELPAPPLLRRGGSAPLRVIAIRRDGFGGEVQLSVESLPTGVTCPAATIAAGSNATTLMFTAAAEAGAWSGNLRVLGKADIGGAPVVRQAMGGTVFADTSDAAAEAVRSRVCEEVALAVSGQDTQPLAIEPAENKTFEVVAGTKLSVPLKLAPRSEVVGKVKLKPGGHPALDPATEAEIDGKSATAAVEFDLAKHALPPGAHTLYVRAEGKVKYVRNPELLKQAEAAKAAAEKSATELAAASKQAAEKLAAAKAVTPPNPEAVKAAGKSAADADAAAKAAEQKKAEATKQAADAGPKEMAAVVYSMPIVVKVTPPSAK